MKLPFSRLSGPLANPLRRTTFDVDAIQRQVRDALAAAKLDTNAGPLKTVAETIRGSLGVAAGGSFPSPTSADAGHARPASPGGKTIAGTHVGAAGRRDYQLYVPTRPVDSPPLIVMLHGCKQSPDDFAAGTRMNEVAEREGFLVVYPAQSANANSSNCWNWFRTQDQAAEGGEPALLAGIVRDVTALHGTDPKRTFVAGLSAGAAMAVILGRTHPALFQAVGVHSGLPFGAAHDVASAFAAMSGGHGAGSARSDRSGGAFVPTIVIHGDRDTTVNAGNGDAVTAQALQSYDGPAPLRPIVSKGRSDAGVGYTRTVHQDADGRPRVEHWTVHGAGHAWAGGSAEGSYTAPDGPDASEAMARFFLAQTAGPSDAAKG